MLVLAGACSLTPFSAQIPERYRNHRPSPGRWHASGRRWRWHRWDAASGFCCHWPTSPGAALPTRAERERAEGRYQHSPYAGTETTRHRAATATQAEASRSSVGLVSAWGPVCCQPRAVQTAPPVSSHPPRVLRTRIRFQNWCRRSGAQTLCPFLYPPGGRRDPEPQLLSQDPPGWPEGPWAPAGRESVRCTPGAGNSM